MSDLKQKKDMQFPSSRVMLFIIVCVVTVATYLVPAGNFQSVVNPETGVAMVDAETFQFTGRAPVNLFRMFVSIKEGFIDGSSIIFLIVFGYFWVYSVMQTGALSAAINRLLGSKAKDSKLFIPIVMFIFALAGSTYGEYETVFGLIPIFVALAIALGYDAIVGMSICGFAVCVGFASATTNPFSIGIAQSIAELPIFSGLLYRWVIFFAMFGVSTLWVMRYGAKIKKDPSASLVKDLDFSSFIVTVDEKQEFTTLHKVLLGGMALTVACIVFGSLKLGWYINEMSAVFIISGILSSLVAGNGPEKIGNDMVTAFSEMAVSIVVVGLSRTILIILQNGNIIDTVVYGLYLPMKGMPTWATAEMMLVAQNIINFFIPSGSGQATAIMPIMVPLADLSGLNRQIAVLAYHFGDGYSNMLWPTASVTIMTGIAKIPLDRWYRFFLPLFGILFLFQSAFMIISVFINYGPF